jgi:O-antigen/teichoic acid export membrane protein
MGTTGAGTPRQGAEETGGHADASTVPRALDSGTTLAHVVRGTTVALLGSMIGGGFGFLFSVLMARALTPSDFGLLVLGLSMLLGAASLSTGADYAAIRFIAAAATPGRKRGAMLTPFVLTTTLILVISIVLGVFAEPISDRLFGQPEFADVLRALAVVLPLTVAAQNLSASLSGLERAQGELARKLVEQGGRLVLAPAAVALGAGVVGAVLGMAAAAGAAVIIVAVLLFRAMPRGGRTRPLGAAKVVRFAWPQIVASAAGQLWLLVNVVVLGRVEDAATVALYGAALAVAVLPALVYNAFSVRFSPVISRLWASGERDELNALMIAVTRWVAMITLPICAVAVALPAGVLQIYGADYRDAGHALALMATATAVNALFGPVEWALIMTGRVWLEMASNVFCAIAASGLVMIIVPAYGLVGAAAAVLAYSLAMNTMKWSLVRSELALNTLSTALIGPVVIVVAAAAAIAGLAAVTDLDQTLLGVGALACAMVALYGVLLISVVGIGHEDRRALLLAVRGSRVVS